MKPWQQMDPLQFPVRVEKEDTVICPDCEGIGLVFQAAFFPKAQPLVGKGRQLIIAPVVLCNQCGKRLDMPFQTAGDVKEV